MTETKVFKKILVGVSSIADPQLTHQKKIIKQLHKISNISTCSPIYYFKTDQEEGLSAVYLLRTQLAPLEMQKKINEIVKSIKNPHAKLQILTFEDVIIRTPKLVLPSDELHRMKKWILPASDVWGDLVHPILGKELRYLSESTGSNEKIEFYAQSKSLLDFLSSES